MSYAVEKHSGEMRVLEYSSVKSLSVHELSRMDMGEGITLFHLIRADFNRALMANCLACINRKGASGIVASRGRRALFGMLNELRCGPTATEKKWAIDVFGKMQSKSAFTYVFRSDITGDLWLGVLDGCDRVSGLVTSRVGDMPAGDFLLDLKQVFSLGEYGRILYASKIFELYYGTGTPGEAAYASCDNPFGCIRNGDIYWKAACVTPGQIFPVFHGEKILLLKSLSVREILVPVTSCRLEPLNRPRLRRNTLELEVEVLDRMQAVYRYP